jgi:short-subunit dehydrogenase
MSSILYDVSCRPLLLVGDTDLAYAGWHREALRASHQVLDLEKLVNNAGIGSVASILAGDADRMEAMIDLNITALTLSFGHPLQ